MHLSFADYKKYLNTLQTVFGLDSLKVVVDEGVCYFKLKDLKKLNTIKNEDPWAKGSEFQKMLAAISAEKGPTGEPLLYVKLRDTGLRAQEAYIDPESGNKRNDGSIKETAASRKEYDVHKAKAGFRPTFRELDSSGKVGPIIIHGKGLSDSKEKQLIGTVKAEDKEKLVDKSDKRHGHH